MNLIERLRSGSEAGEEARALEAAGEIERCWDRITVLEDHVQQCVTNLEAQRLTLAERDTEIERLKGLKDEEALAAAHADGFQHGYRIATATLWPVVGTLLKDRTHGPQDSH